MKRIVILIISVLFCLSVGAQSLLAFGPEPPAPPLAKYEPPDGKVLTIIGQDLTEIEGYNRDVASGNPDLMPGGTTLYVHLEDYANDANNVERFIGNSDYRNMILHLSINISGINQKIADGLFDVEIIKMAGLIARLGRPVFLRIGYEFDNPGHGNPDPGVFKQAWKHMVDTIRQQGVDNFATVFASTFQVELPLFFPTFEDYYPGDDYVDWMGFSFWGGPLTEFDGMLDFARDHQKPVMIAESAPMTARFENDCLTALIWWPFFFERYFSLIEENSDVIKAFHYINHDWSRNNDLWLSTPIYWVFVDMDTRIQENDYIRKSWISEMKEDKYLHASDDLFTILGQ